MIEFSIPSFTTYKWLNLFLLDLMDEHPEMFHECKITSCYDSYDCNWNGGRSSYTQYSLAELMSTLLDFNIRGVEVRQTFTNLNALNYLDDRICNEIASVMNSQQFINSCTVAKDELYEYLKRNYQNLKFCWSTTKGITDIDTINALSETDMIIPSYEMNRDYEALKQLKHKENIELLACDLCVDHCEYREQHYQSESDRQNCTDRENFVSFQCPYEMKMFDLYDLFGVLKHNILWDDIKNIYEPMGFTKFKISSRVDNPLVLVDKYINYLVKDEFKDRVRQKLLMFIFFRR